MYPGGEALVPLEHHGQLITNEMWLDPTKVHHLLVPPLAPKTKATHLTKVHGVIVFLVAQAALAG